MCALVTNYGGGRKGPESPLQTRILFHIAHHQNDEKKLLEYHTKLGESHEDRLSLASIHYLRTHYQEATDIYKRILLENRHWQSLPPASLCTFNFCNMLHGWFQMVESSYLSNPSWELYLTYPPVCNNKICSQALKTYWWKILWAVHLGITNCCGPCCRDWLALNVYVALCYCNLDYYDVSLEILDAYLQVSNAID